MLLLETFTTNFKVKDINTEFNIMTYFKNKWDSFSFDETEHNIIYKSKRRPYCSVNQQALRQFEIKDWIRLSSRAILHCCSAVLCNEDTQSFYIKSSFNAAYPLNTILLPSTSTLPTNHLIGLFSTSKNLKNVKFYLHISKKTSEKHINR